MFEAGTAPNALRVERAGASSAAQAVNECSELRQTPLHDGLRRQKTF
jgi:hypothetical protein